MFTPGWCPFCASPISFRCNDECLRKALAWIEELQRENSELKAKVNGLEDEVKVAFAMKPPIPVQLNVFASSEGPKVTKVPFPDPPPV